MTILTLIAAIFSFGLTIGVLWINPHRFSNQVFALVTVIQTIALGIVYRAKTIAESRPPDYIEQFEALLRANAAVIAFLPTSIWLLKNAIVLPHDRTQAVKRSIPLLILSVVTVCVCYSDSFIFLDEVGLLQRGPAYYIYSIMALGVYGICLFQIIGQMRANTGIRRVELQFLALNIGGAALLLAALNALGNYLEMPALKSAGVIFMLTASALTAWALLFHRVFNAGELLLQLGQRILFVFVLTGGIFSIWRISTLVFNEPLSLVISVGLFSPVAIWIDRKSRAWFDHRSRKKFTSLRNATFQTASAEFDTTTLLSKFEDLLRNECRSERCSLLLDNGRYYTGSDFPIEKDCPAVKAVIEFGWATPESLNRRWATPTLKELQKLMATNSLGLLLSVPRSSLSPTMLVALGVRIDESPFTYPEIQRLQNVVELMDGILMRSRIVNQATLRSRLDYLAMASRGLAHDLKNLFTPIWTWMLHDLNRYQVGSIESNVYNSASRALGVMKDYIDEAIFFTDRSQPHFESVDLRKVAETVCEITRPRAVSRGVTIQGECGLSDCIVADSILLQRAIANLVNNAIDASARGNLVTVAISDAVPDRIRIAVSDEGKGIHPSHVSKVFDPYFTTKNFGDDGRGFGLGLTIVQKIALLHQGSVCVQSTLNVGTTILIELPKRPELQ
jgi:signal transduction histidine kinase